MRIRISSLVVALFIVSLQLGGIAFALPYTRLVAYYPFSGSANDESGNGNNGTVSGAQLTTDRFGNPSSAYSFDGINDVIIVPDSPSLDLGTSDLSLAVWMRSSGQADAENRGLIAKQDSAWGKPGYTLVVVDAPTLDIAYGTVVPGAGAHALGTTPIHDESWHLIVFTADRDGYGKIYVDGRLDNDPVWIASPDGSVNNDLPLYIGKVYSSYLDEYYFHGDIDDVAIYSRLLSDSEIKELYSAAPVPEPSTMLLLGTGLVGLAGIRRKFRRYPS